MTAHCIYIPRVEVEEEMHEHEIRGSQLKHASSSVDRHFCMVYIMGTKLQNRKRESHSGLPVEVM